MRKNSTNNHYLKIDFPEILAKFFELEDFSKTTCCSLTEIINSKQI